MSTLSTPSVYDFPSESRMDRTLLLDGSSPLCQMACPAAQCRIVQRNLPGIANMGDARMTMVRSRIGRFEGRTFEAIRLTVLGLL